MRTLKIWGGMMNMKKTRNPNGGNQTRTLVAATTKKRAVELLDRISMGYFNDNFVETGNAVELATATEEGVWVNEGTCREPEWERRVTT